ncbi:hypothetical protein DB88DRAFT_472624 [Papiliotrema laurentii]|uniref:Uncharacterized protein n=1 Tax=Papiliotrema laurentii TaxID=5418 RepID=A0AAD9CXS3_PAPLA|nr:hypothetical protein DB88DRAFT_472624 [Papiliotrema laurentii]
MTNPSLSQDLKQELEDLIQEAIKQRGDFQATPSSNGTSVSRSPHSRDTSLPGSEASCQTCKALLKPYHVNILAPLGTSLGSAGAQPPQSSRVGTTDIDPQTQKRRILLYPFFVQRYSDNMNPVVSCVEGDNGESHVGQVPISAISQKLNTLVNSGLHLITTSTDWNDTEAHIEFKKCLDDILPAVEAEIPGLEIVRKPAKTRVWTGRNSYRDLDPGDYSPSIASEARTLSTFSQRSKHPSQKTWHGNACSNSSLEPPPGKSVTRSPRGRHARHAPYPNPRDWRMSQGGPKTRKGREGPHALPTRGSNHSQQGPDFSARKECTFHDTGI